MINTLNSSSKNIHSYKAKKSQWDSKDTIFFEWRSIERHAASFDDSTVFITTFYTFFAFLCIWENVFLLDTKIVKMNQFSWQKTEADEGGLQLKETTNTKSSHSQGTVFIGALRTFL